MIGKRIQQLRKDSGLTQADLGNKLGVIKQTVSSWENDISNPNSDALISMARIFNVSVDYLLANDEATYNGIESALGYSGGDESAVSFPHKLANQIDFNGTKISDLANVIGVEEKTILEWLSGSNDGYTSYYKQLSEYFNVKVRYWTSPHAISPGIEPSMEEYMLILLYREYKETGSLNDLYGSLESYFPGIKLVNDSYSEKLLDAFEILNEDNKDIIIGEVKKCLKEQRYEDSVAADSKKVVGK